MFQKMKSRKGFTLIEMLVVIAIIAILVAIIIPVVSNSTSKAAAAANAANLRSMKAEAVTLMLTGQTDSSTNVTVTVDANGKVTGVASTDNAPVAKGVGACTAGWKAFFNVNATTGDVTAYYAAAQTDTPTCTIKYFADIAEKGDGN